MSSLTFIKQRNNSISYGLLLIAPFFSLLLALRQWKTPYARNMLIGVIVFMGMTALPEGDLESYQAIYYYNANQSLETMWYNLISLKEGKFYIGLLSFLFGLIFQHHVVYFGFLYFIFGYYLVNFVFLVYDYNKSIVSTKWGGFLFISLALFFSIRNSLNLAFYTGAIFIIYYLTKSLLQSKKKLLLLILLAPLFHFSLAIVFLPIVMFLFLKSKTYVCILLVLLSYAIPQTVVTGVLGNLASDSEGTLIESKYDSYASEGGMERLNAHYTEGALRANFKLTLLNSISAFIFTYLINVGLIIIFLLKKKLLNKDYLLYWYNVILLAWALANVMDNISNGIRYKTFPMTLGVAFFVVLFQNNFKTKLLHWYYSLTFPVLLIYGLMNLYASNKIISSNFFVSNYFIEIIAPSAYEKSN